MGREQGLVTEVPAAPPVGGSVVQIGDWLADRHRLTDAWLAAWLDALAEFDAAQGWAADGQLSCVEWLMWRVGLARTTAFEKLRVAHELRRRPVLADALASGRVSYSAVRVMARAEGAEPEVDEALVAVAEVGTVTDVERAVRAYQLHADQVRPVPDPRTRRGLRLVPLGDGTTRLEAILTDVEAAELDLAIRTVMARTDASPGDEYADAYADTSDEADAPASGEAPAEAGDEYADAYASDPAGEATWPQRRADALVELARFASAAVAPAGDRYLLHLVVREDGRGSLLGGEPLDWASVARIACDSATVVHCQGDGGEPLSLGRLRRTWSTAQRRAIRVRDGGRCRFAGCRRTTADVHHLLPWEDGGSTDVSNGLLICPRHHTLVHEEFLTAGQANGLVRFFRLDGTPVGATAPARWR